MSVLYENIIFLPAMACLACWLMRPVSFRMFMWKHLLYLANLFGYIPSIFGSSGTLSRYKSSFFLKSSNGHLVMFLIMAGRLLNNLGPCIWKLWALMPLTSVDNFLLLAGIFNLVWFLLSFDTSYFG